jgi:peptide/histidine transporter 3/4
MDTAITVTGGDTSVQTPLLDDGVDGAVNYKGQPVRRSRSGGWRSASFIIGVEVAERFAFYGISSNLITYLTGPLGQSTAAAAENVNAWSGTASLSPLLGAFIADSFLGRFRTIYISSLLYILGLGLLTLSAVLFPTTDCEKAANVSLSSSSLSCSSPPKLQVILFFFSLYLVAFAQGGHKPCVQAFGADQFDSNDEKESKSKNSFFNWWYFALCAGTLSTLLILNYIQDNLSWGLGFGIPCIVMGLALVVFLLGTTTYRFTVTDGHRKSSPFVRIGQVFVTAIKNRRTTTVRAISHEEEARGILHDEDFEQFKFLNKALLSPEETNKICKNDVKEAKSVLRLIPIWASCLVYAIVFAQSPTLFTKQGASMDRSIGPNFKIPAATLQSFISLSIVILIPIYDRVFVPITRMVTHRTSGITMLQRIGIGIALSILSMVVAATVETKRLNVARTSQLIDQPNMTVPMSVWWLVPQYLLFGASDVFTMVGLQEFFYDQIPSELKSLGLALYLSIFGVGSFISSFLISIIDKTTRSSDGGDGWFSDNLNKGHLDYFYWLLASISTVAFVAYLLFAKSYIYNRANTA